MHLPTPRPEVRQILLIADRKNQPQTTHQPVAGGHATWASQHKARGHVSTGSKKDPEIFYSATRYRPVEEGIPPPSHSLWKYGEAPVLPTKF